MDRALFPRQQSWASDYGGLWVAGGIMGLWVVSGLVLLWTPLPGWWWLLAIFLRTFLQTGLFIVAHDAMHGTIAPGHRGLNDRIGTVALAAYACLSLTQCRNNHHRHHRFAGLPGDPDFHDGQHRDPWHWYGRFMREYLSWEQCLGLGLLWSLLIVILHEGMVLPWGIALSQVVLGWTLPLLLSSVQLFLFGTYVPHRQGIRSSDYPVWLSFLTCYHFGYHREHHNRPDIPWYGLPSRRWSA